MVGRDHTRPGGAPDGRSGSQTSAPSKRHFLGSGDLGWSLLLQITVRTKHDPMASARSALGANVTRKLLAKEK